MPVGWQVFCDEFRRTAPGRQDIDRRLTELDLVGDRNQRAVWRDAMVVVAECREVRIDPDRTGITIRRQTVDQAICIKHQIVTIRRPVGRFEQFLRLPDNPALAGSDIVDLDGASQCQGRLPLNDPGNGW
ncbi:hypothetical protein D3C80_1365050 [compost metagenome]